MFPTRDVSAACLVLSSASPICREVIAPAIALGSAADGQQLAVHRVDPADTQALVAQATLATLEHGALVVVDLVEIDNDLFPLVEWLARVRPASVLLFRHGNQALPFELRSFLVRTLAFDLEEVTPLRVSVGTLATLGAASRVRATRAGRRQSERVRLRRERNGVAGLLDTAVRHLVQGDGATARAALAECVEREPKAPDLLLRAAVLERMAGHWLQARDQLQRAVRGDPESAPAWRELGIVRQQLGEAHSTQALRNAIDIDGDFEATVALALRESREGDADEGARLLERAMRLSGGQLNLVLPTLEARAQSHRKVSFVAWEQERLETVLSIRRGQADATPPADAPWSHFDAARALLLLGKSDEALRCVQAAKAYLTAPWQTQTFGRSLDGFERAGVEVAPLREALGITPADEHVAAADAPARPPFHAEPRSAQWFATNVPCMQACPVGTDAGAYVHLIAQRRFDEAFHVARAPNPLASVCGRICAAPCEDACRRGHIDEPVQIRTLKRFLTERHGVEGYAPRVDDVLRAGTPPCIEGESYLGRLRPLGPTDAPRRVAIVGGGPAGLACAHDLAVLGHKVTVFEMSHQLGGMMRQGIPIYRLSRDLLELEIGAILSLGVDVRLGTGLSASFPLADVLAEGFDAAFLSSGAGRGRDLDVEGSHLDGVVRAIDFLLNANQGYRMDLGRCVLVVGGGNVALDVARTARLGRAPDPLNRKQAGKTARRAFGEQLPGEALQRAVHGAKREVHVLARQPMGEWPAQRTVRGTEELEEAREEGVVFHPLRGVRRFLGVNGKLTGAELAEVVQVYDEHGNYAPVYGPHTAEVIACDTAFLAVGQTPDLDYLSKTPEVRQTRRGLIEVDDALATTMPGVFAGGDAAFGPRTLIEAVSDGKRAARGIHRYLVGGTPPAVRTTFEELHPRGIPTASGYDAIPRESPTCRALTRRTGIAEVESGFDEDAAVRQASRCLVCHVQTVYDGDLCIACGRCTDVCPHACLSFVDPTDARIAGISVDGAGDTVLMLKDEDACVRCGLCAERCPTGAMTMEQFHMAAEA